MLWDMQTFSSFEDYVKYNFETHSLYSFVQCNNNECGCPIGGLLVFFAAFSSGSLCKIESKDSFFKNVFIDFILAHQNWIK